jgi:hypothetical protein
MTKPSHAKSPHMIHASSSLLHEKNFRRKRGQRTWRLFNLGSLAQWYLHSALVNGERYMQQWFLSSPLMISREREMTSTNGLDQYIVSEGCCIIDQSHKLKYKCNTGLRIVVEGQSMLLLVIIGLF